MSNEATLAEWALAPFEDAEHIVEVMSDPRYRDPARDDFRQAIYQKMSISAVGVTAREVGETQIEYLGRVAKEQQQNEKALGEVAGRLALNPDKRSTK